MAECSKEQKAAYSLILTFTNIFACTSLGFNQSSATHFRLTKIKWWTYYRFVFIATINGVGFCLSIKNLIRFGEDLTGINKVVLTLNTIFYMAAIHIVIISLFLRQNLLHSLIEKQLSISANLPKRFWYKILAFFAACSLRVFIPSINNIRLLLLSSSHYLGLSLYESIYEESHILLLSVFSSFYASLQLILCESFFKMNSELIEDKPLNNLKHHITQHCLLFEICKDINRTFKPGLLFTIMVSISECLNTTNTILKSKSATPTSFVWATAALFNAFLILMSSTRTAHEAKKTTWILPFTAFNAHDELKEEVHEFILMHQSQDFQFSVYGLFKLNNELFTSIVGTLITYGVIIAQFSDDNPATPCTQ